VFGVTLNSTDTRKHFHNDEQSKIGNVLLRVSTRIRNRIYAASCLEIPATLHCSPTTSVWGWKLLTRSGAR
jgi:hypothetical protein